MRYLFVTVQFFQKRWSDICRMANAAAEVARGLLGLGQDLAEDLGEANEQQAEAEEPCE